MIAAKGGPRLQQIAEHPLELGGFIASELAMSADLLASTKFKIDRAIGWCLQGQVSTSAIVEWKA